MFTVFSRAKFSETRSRNILLQYAYAPITVGLIATVLGFIRNGFVHENFWAAMSMSVGILISGLCILIYSLKKRRTMSRLKVRITLHEFQAT